MNQFFSQFGEDKVLDKIFSGKSGTCLEVGAHDGVHLSNTYHFEKIGWQCILVEPNGDLCKKIRRSRKAKVFECAASEKCGEAVLQVCGGEDDVYSSLQTAVTAVGGPDHKQTIVETRTIDSMLEETGQGAVDFITIDVEGHEREALLGLTLTRWKPRLVLLEDNTGMADPWPESYMSQAGYYRFWRSGVNDWYASHELGRLRLLGKIVLAGCFSWKGLLKGTLPRRFTRGIIVTKRKLTGRI